MDANEAERRTGRVVSAIGCDWRYSPGPGVARAVRFVGSWVRADPDAKDAETFVCAELTPTPRSVCGGWPEMAVSSRLPLLYVPGPGVAEGFETNRRDVDPKEAERRIVFGRSICDAVALPSKGV